MKQVQDFVKQNHPASVESQVATNKHLWTNPLKSSQVTLLLLPPPPPHWHLVSCHIGYTTKTNFVQHGHDAWACHIVSSGLRKWASEYYISLPNFGPMKVQGIQWKNVCHHRMYEKRKCKCCATNTRDVSHRGLPIYNKTYLKAKEELWKLKYFTMQKHNLQKILLKKPKSFKIL